VIATVLDTEAALIEKITNHAAVIGVVGVGYVGMPLAVEKAKVGFPVIGFDQDPGRVEKLRRGESYIKDVPSEELASHVASGKFRGTGDFRLLSACDVIIICVPTPLTANRDPDVSYIRSVAREIRKSLRVGQLVVLESTTYPGTTEEVLKPLFEETGLRAGTDFFLAFSPERVDPGNQRYTTRNTSKVVGGITDSCLRVAAHFYSQTIQKVLRVSSSRVAEMTKVFENTFRAVNIALVNEMALLCDRLGISIWEVVDAAATKEFGIMRFDPGPGVGGHCIPLDPFYLAWKAREHDFSTRFIELAGEINLRMPYFVLEKLNRILNESQRCLNGARIAVVGVAYKRNSEDCRESPAMKIISLLEQGGACVEYHDPFVPAFTLDGTTRESLPLTAELLSEADCVLIITDHSTIDWPFVVRHSARILDTRNATRDVQDRYSNVTLL
jgi:UDP-N-acetyl-D-glucosamine dehydrogenase